MVQQASRLAVHMTRIFQSVDVYRLFKSCRLQVTVSAGFG
jgi:hypothetical protein